jgi:biotin transport system substrate-specific component
MNDNHGTLLFELRTRVPRSRVVGFEALTLVAASAFVALLAQVRVPLPFTPVPVTGQTLGIVLIGASLGSIRGSAAVVLYILEGIAGLPVFAGLQSGLGHVFGPTGGYLAGFVAAAWLVGRLAEAGWDRRWNTSFLAMLAGNAIIYLFGLAGLAPFVGLKSVVALGLVPFLAGDLLKTLIASLLLPAVWKLVRR